MKENSLLEIKEKEEKKTKCELEIIYCSSVDNKIGNYGNMKSVGKHMDSDCVMVEKGSEIKV